MSEIALGPEQRISNVETIVRKSPEVAGLQSYEYFENGSAKGRDAFIRGEVVCPDLTSIGLTEERVVALRDQMPDALKNLMPSERSEKSEAFY